MIDAADLAAAKTRFDVLREVPGLALVAQTSGGEWHGPCPQCGGSDRFVAWPRHPAGPRCWCRQCHPEVMDPITFLQWRDGVTFTEAAARLGVASSDVRPQPVAYYHYQDAAGALLYQVVRYAPKSFRQRRPRPGVTDPRNDVDTDWIWNLQDTPRVLYQLPALLAADPLETVWICEGEKDAAALITRGLVATTAPHGAGKWRPEYSVALAGRTVVVLPDADAPGQAHGAAVAAACAPVARSVRIVNLPGRDVSDWLDAGGTVEALIALARATPKWAALPPELPPLPPELTPSAPGRFRVLNDAESDAIPPPEWLVEGYLLAGALNLIHGNGGAGKSFVCLDLACAMAAGQLAWRGIPCQPGPVLYIAAEGPEEVSQRKRAWKATFAQPALPDFYLVPERVPFLDPTVVPDLLASLPPGLRPRLIIVDTLARIMGGDGNENETRDMGGFVAACDALRVATGATLLIVHHDNRAGQIRGNLALINAARNSIAVSNDDGVVTLESDKHNNSGDLPPLRFCFRPALDTVVLAPAAPQDRAAGGPLSPSARKVLEALAAPSLIGGSSYKDLCVYTQINERTVLRALDALDTRGYQTPTGPPKTPQRRYTITARGRAALGLEGTDTGPDLLGDLWGSTDTDIPPAPAQAGIDTADSDRPGPGVTLTDIADPVVQARTDTTDIGPTQDRHAPMSDRLSPPGGIYPGGDSRSLPTIPDVAPPARNPWGLPPPGSVAPPDNPCPSCHDWHWAWLKSGGWATLCQMPRGTPPPPGDESVIAINATERSPV